MGEAVHFAVCVGLVLLLVVPPSCDTAPEPLDWPSFDETVIEVGRRVLHERERTGLPQTPSTPDSVNRDERHAESIAATEQAILEKIKCSVDRRGTEWQRATEVIQELGPAAIDPLLDILANDSLPRRFTDRVVSLLIPLGHEQTSD
ncbi:MAG: hypothetical protein PVI86_07150, partial [Phycisphaerae bacterium]